MSGATHILARPEVIGSAVIIIGAAAVALRWTNPKRWKPRQTAGVSSPSGGPQGEAVTTPPSPATPAYAAAAAPPPPMAFEVSSGHTDVRFSDVAGLDEAIAEMR